MKFKYLIIVALTLLLIFNAYILISRFRQPMKSHNEYLKSVAYEDVHPMPSIFVERIEDMETELDNTHHQQSRGSKSRRDSDMEIGGSAESRLQPSLDDFPVESPRVESLPSHSFDSSQHRAQSIREAFLHAFRDGYMKHAFPRDELLPISAGGYSPWISSSTQGMALTAIDALDTMWIMGFRELFADTVQRVVQHWEKHSWPNGNISLFETIIRIIGGLISAFELSHDQRLLHLAQKVADRVMPAFSNQPSHNLPSCQINLSTRHHSCPHWTENTLITSEFSTVQLELTRLSQLTSDPRYKEAADRVTNFLRTHAPRDDGLYYVQLDIRSPTWRSNHVTLGMWGDSTYEYFLKMWILSGGQDETYWELYEKALNGIVDKLVVKSRATSLTYIQEIRGDVPVNKMEHLVCFAGGMFALGAYQRMRLHGAYSNYERDLILAKEFTKTCYETYRRMPSGLGAETTKWDEHPDKDFVVGINKYVLRPETVESLYYLWKVTGDSVYRDWAWDIFQAIERHCKTPHGYCSVNNVDSSNPQKIDQMHSYFLAETLKYLYLTFEEGEEVLPLSEWVFNTEAHPVRIGK